MSDAAHAPAAAIRATLHRLNEEADLGATHARAILDTASEDWETLLAARPAWVRFGTLEALLDAAHEELDRDPEHALGIAQLVLRHIDGVALDPTDEFLRVQLRGTAWKEHASALYALKRYEDAELPIAVAIRTLEDSPVLAVDHARARFVQAQIWAERGRRADAATALTEIVGVFGEHAQAQLYVYAVHFLGYLLFDDARYADAAAAFSTALAEAERLGDTVAAARLRNNLAHAAVFLGALDDAMPLFVAAIETFAGLQMDVEVQRAVWGLARVAHARGQLVRARETLEAVYAEFLRRGLPLHAARILVDLSDVAASLAGDVPGARLLCANFVTTVAQFDVADDLRRAASFLAERTARAQSEEDVRAATAPVRAYVVAALRSPSAAFVPTAA